MIICEKIQGKGCHISINGPSRDVFTESLYMIESINDSFMRSSPKQAEQYKKLVLSAVLELDGFCIFNAPSNGVLFDLSALHGQDRNGGDI